MKKVISLLTVVVMYAMTCSAQSAPSVADTISRYLGASVGNIVMRSVPKNYNKDVFVRTFEQTIKQSNDSSEMAARFLGAAVVGIITKTQEEYNLTVDPDIIMAEVKKALDGDTLTIEECEELEHNMSALAERIKEEEAIAKANTPEAIATKKAGEKFMMRKLTSKKYKRTDSGLLYRVIKAGNGECFGATSGEILVTYKGCLINGEVVELEEEGRGVVPELVTPGCGEMLSMMKPGMKVEVIIPSELAYGIYGNPQRGIGPNETLVFEIETHGLVIDGESEE